MAYVHSPSGVELARVVELGERLGFLAAAADDVPYDTGARQRRPSPGGGDSSPSFQRS